MQNIITSPSSQHADFLASWSGGKDSCFAVMQSIQNGYTPKVLLNVLNEGGKISRSHGIPADILEAQANAAGLPIRLISSSWQAYEPNFIAALHQLKQQYALQHAVFGDIDLQPHRDWEEKVCKVAGLEALLPLWQQNRKKLVLEMIDRGIKAVIVSCNTTMGEKYLGRLITEELVTELEEIGIDACGENGEYHTLVTDCPLFTQPIHVRIARTRTHEAYCFSELALI